jgi:hypothetical protein
MPTSDDRGESPSGRVAPNTLPPGGPSPDDAPAVDGSTVRRIKELPREVGIMLVSVGTLGLVLPGLMGTPAIIAGGLVLWPGTFSGVEGWLRGMKQLGRFLDDLERRYPESTKK